MGFMFDFRLKVFYTVAKRLNFTRAANDLNITQPAVTRHINELETHFKLSLIERSGNRRVTLTPAGSLLLEHSERLLDNYQRMQFDMDALLYRAGGKLRLGASNTIGQYVLPSILARFKKRFPDVKIDLLTGNSEQILQALIDKDIDLGAIEGLNKNPLVSYQEFLKDEIVLVTSTKNAAINKQIIRPDQLRDIPLVIRETGSGSLDVVIQALKSKKIKLSDLQVEIILGNTESIKAYLEESNCAAFLSVQSVYKELKSNQLKVIDVSGLDIRRTFSFIHLHGQMLPLAASFSKYLLKRD